MMASGFNPDNFRRGFQQDGVGRTALFEVTFGVPPILKGKYNTDKLTYRAVATSIPNVKLDLDRGRRGGLTQWEYFPTSKEFGPLTVTFICDENGIIMGMFQDWVSAIFPTENNTNVNNYRIAYKNEYAIPIHITHFDSFGKATSVFEFNETFPDTVNEVTLNWGSFDDILSLSVTFAYRDYTMKAGDGSPLTTFSGLEEFTKSFETGGLQSAVRNLLPFKSVISRF